MVLYNLLLGLQVSEIFENGEKFLNVKDESFIPILTLRIVVPVARKWVSPRRMLEREDGWLGRFPLRIRGFNHRWQEGQDKGRNLL